MEFERHEGAPRVRDGARFGGAPRPSSRPPLSAAALRLRRRPPILGPQASPARVSTRTPHPLDGQAR